MMNKKCLKIQNKHFHCKHTPTILFAFVLSLFPCLFLLTSCDQTFQPIQDNSEAPFSLFGYLDASADTQWVRVTPIRGQIDLSANAPDINVILEDLETGHSESLIDSLFLFGDGFHILNAWNTTDMLKPNGSYRITAERPDGASSRATITMPPDFPTPRLELYPDVKIAYLFINGVENLIDAQIRSRARIIAPSAGWNYVDVFWTSLSEIAREIQVLPTPGSYVVRMSTGAWRNVRPHLTAPPAGWDDLTIEYLDSQVFVASGGPEWREEFRGLDDYRYSLPEAISNVESGTGYMFGIVSKSVPFKNCFDDQGEIIACPEEVPLY